MDRLPSPEERQWLTHALKKVLARGGAHLLDAAPLVEPVNEWFPETWAATAAHGHRLAQRLMYYAGLTDLAISLYAYPPVLRDDEAEPWDAGTAGWFAGIHNGRARFGLQTRQFSDPEAAAGVLAHEVAHAWRHHHHLVVDEREKEEFLTDVTTIALGFGILSTNNTDRYRSSGTWSVTTWSYNSAGYLPPQSMSWLLAVWCSAREVPGERKAIERHLEPNQQSYFRAALEELERGDADPRELLRGPRVAAGRPLPVVAPGKFVPREPSPDELFEPKQVERDPKWNRGQQVYQKSRGDSVVAFVMAACAVFLVAWLAVLSIDDKSMARAVLIAAFCSAVAGGFAARRARRPACTTCDAHIDSATAECPGCGGSVGPRVSMRELRRIREDELEQRAMQDTLYEECDRCEPESPCEVHAPVFRIGPEEPEPEAAKPKPTQPAKIRFPRKLAAFAATVAAVFLGFAWWRQTHVRVFLDNSLGSPVTVEIDGRTLRLEGRPPVAEALAPGKHHISAHDASHEIDRFDAVVEKQSLTGALFSPRFYVYSVGAAGVYRRTKVVYAVEPSERMNTTALIALQRWFAQDDANYVFADPPEKLSGGDHVVRTWLQTESISPHDLPFALLMEGRKNDAIRALRDAIGRDRCDSDLHDQLIDLLPRDGALQEARAWVASCDSTLDAHRAYQDVVRRVAANDPLADTYRERLRVNATAANHYLYGRLLRGEAAIAEFREAVRADPHLAWARIALGRQLLEAEQDADAYSTLEQSLREPKADGIATVYFAMAAVATHKEKEALQRLEESSSNGFDARWLLYRAQGDWASAKLLLTEREAGNPTPETIIDRARLARDSGEFASAMADDLDRKEETHSGAVALRLEDALEHSRFADAASMDLAPLRHDGEPVIEDVYVAEAALLAHLPDAQARVASLRTKLAKQPRLAALLDAAAGNISKDALMNAIADDNVTMAPHAWFALGVHAAIGGGSPLPLFAKAADRALDREFPYRVARALSKQ